MENQIMIALMRMPVTQVKNLRALGRAGNDPPGAGRLPAREQSVSWGLFVPWLCAGESASRVNGKLLIAGKKIHQGLHDFGGEIPYFYSENWGALIEKSPTQEK
jgi:hypothetical protein